MAAGDSFSEDVPYLRKVKYANYYKRDTTDWMPLLKFHSCETEY